MQLNSVEQEALETLLDYIEPEEQENYEEIKGISDASPIPINKLGGAHVYKSIRILRAALEKAP